MGESSTAQHAGWKNSVNHILFILDIIYTIIYEFAYVFQQFKLMPLMTELDVLAHVSMSSACPSVSV